jgi:hypothetical protein
LVPVLAQAQVLVRVQMDLAPAQVVALVQVQRRLRQLR